jgi:predicted transposase/invertase (TIGR01784 family)
MSGRAASRERWTLDPKNDYVFTLLFGAAKNSCLLMSLLDEVLRPSAAIASVELLPPRPDPVDIDEKVIALDLRVVLDSGEQIDVEMQTRRRADLRERVLLYWSRLYTSQLSRGQPYSRLKRCAVILITDFSELRSARFHSAFQVRERGSGELFSPQLELHVLELPKLRAKEKDDDEPRLAAWCRFLSADTDDQLESLAMQHPFLREAKTALDEISADGDVRRRAQRREDELYFYEHGLHVSREEGRQEGALRQTRSTLTRLLELKFGGVPEEARARLTAASQNELDLWLERLLTAENVEAVFR